MSKNRSSKVVYISHGGGPLPILGDKSHEKMVSFLKKYPSTIQTPDEILVISAHWEEGVPTIIDADSPPLLYDYSGFPDESYSISYPARGNSELVAFIRHLLEKSGIASKTNSSRGLDHGVFIPLKLMYPRQPYR